MLDLFVHVHRSRIQPPAILLSRLVVSLDKYPAPHLDKERAQNFGLPDFELDAAEQDQEDAIINQSLISAVHAFSARWLPASHFRTNNPLDLQESMAMREHFIKSVWQRAHKDVVAVLARPSYRSILALYLFGTTPTPLKTRERRIVAHCQETAIRHYVQLRAQTSPVARCSSTTSVQVSANFEQSTPEVKAREEYDHLADTAYWFGIVIDGSRAVTKCQPSILLPSLNGESQVWDPIRKQVENADMIYRAVQSTKGPLTDDTVMAMIQYGFAYKTLFWKAISWVQDYFFYHTVDLPVETLVGNVACEMDRFQDIFGPFLDHCALDYVLLSEKSRLCYSELLHPPISLVLT